MKNIDMMSLKLQQDDQFITLKIIDTIDISILKQKLSSYLEPDLLSLLDNLINDEGVLHRNQEIIINLDLNTFEQYASNRFVYFYLGNRELLINKFDHTYFYLEDEVVYSSKEMKLLEKEEIHSKITDILSYLKRIHNEYIYDNRIDLLYYDMDLVNYDKVKRVSQDDVLELVIPNFYEISPVWMKMAIVYKKTKEIIGTIEFNFKLDEKDYYDYRGNISYEIKEEYRRNGYATKALSLVRKYLLDNKINRSLYVSTEYNNESSQRVAIKNQGLLCYQGSVPKSSVVAFLGKVDQVKIYRIENM